MRVYIDSQLYSISAFSTDLKNIQTPHSLFRDFRADETFTARHGWSGGRFQVWVQVLAPACHLAISPGGYSRRRSKVYTAKAMAELMRAHSGTAWAGRTGKHKHRVLLVCCSCCWLRLARLRDTCYHSCNTDSVRPFESQKGFKALWILACYESLFFSC